MKNFLLGLIVLVVFVGLALLVTAIAMSGGDSKVENKDNSGTVEIANADKIVGATEAETEEATVSTESAEQDDLSATPIVEDSSQNDANEEPDENSEKVISGAESSNSSAGYQSGDYFSNNHTDSKAPVYLIKPSTVSVYKGTEFDISSYVGYADDVDRDVEVSYDKEIDTSETGSDSVTVTLTDDAGHSTTATFNVNIIDGSPNTSSSDGGASAPGKVDFDTFAENYGGEDVSLGIDVSRWQGEIDFNKVKAAGCEYVIIRLGGYDDGECYTDRTYAQNIRNAKAAGLKVGIYWHAEESNAAEVKQSADYLKSILGNETLDFPIAYDWEDFAHFQSYGMNLYDINDCFNMFADEMKKSGFDTCLYSSKNFLENVWTNERGYKVWLANYATQTAYSGSYFMWQQTSSGKIDGINSAVDFNIYYGKLN